MLIMAQDEGCFGRISRAHRCWAPPGMRPHAPCQVVREYMYVYSAVAPAQGEMTSLILPSADTAMMTLFLEHVSQTFSKYFIVMQVDGAGWHHSDELVIPSNIRLITQPPYSPEVNPAGLTPEKSYHSRRAIAEIPDVSRSKMRQMLKTSPFPRFERQGLLDISEDNQYFILNPALLAALTPVSKLALRAIAIQLQLQAARSPLFSNTGRKCRTRSHFPCT